MPLNIRVDEEHRITSDKFQYMLQKRTIVKGEETWKTLCYYPTFQSLLQELVHREVRLSDVSSVEELIEATESVSQRVTELCKGTGFKVVQDE